MLECQVGEFLCDDGKCILEAELCNGVRDCDDGSDETSGFCTYNKTEGNSKFNFNVIEIHSQKCFRVKIRSFLLIILYFRFHR